MINLHIDHQKADFLTWHNKLIIYVNNKIKLMKTSIKCNQTINKVNVKEKWKDIKLWLMIHQQYNCWNKIYEIQQQQNI